MFENRLSKFEFWKMVSDAGCKFKDLGDSESKRQWGGVITQKFEVVDGKGIFLDGCVFEKTTRWGGGTQAESLDLTNFNAYEIHKCLTDEWLKKLLETEEDAGFLTGGVKSNIEKELLRRKMQRENIVK